MMITCPDYIEMNLTKWVQFTKRATKILKWGQSTSSIDETIR